MNLVQTLFKNALALAVSAIAYRVGLAAVEIVIARNLVPADYGVYATALGFATLFLVVLDLGVNLGLVRVLARGEAIAPVYFGNSLVIRLGLAALIYPIMLVVARLLYPTPVVTLTALLGLFVILLSFQDLLAAVFQGRGEMEGIAFLRILLIAAVGGSVFWVLKEGGSVRAVAWAHVGAGGGTLAVGLAVTLARCRPRIDRRRLFWVVTDSYLYGLVAIFSVLAFRLGVVVLSLVARKEDVGIFAAAQRIAEVLGKVPVLLSMVLIPLMFRSHKEAPDRLDRLYRINIRLTGIGVLPLAAAVALFAPEVIGRLYGESYSASTGVIRILALALPFSFLSVALGDQLTARDRQSRRTWIHAAVVGVGLTAHSILANAFGPVGSACAAVLTEATLFGLLAWGLQAGVASLAPLRSLARPAAAVLLASVVSALSRPSIPPPATVAVFGGVYALAVLLTRAVEIEEIRTVLAALTGRRRPSPSP